MSFELRDAINYNVWLRRHQIVCKQAVSLPKGKCLVQIVTYTDANMCITHDPLNYNSLYKNYPKWRLRSPAELQGGGGNDEVIGNGAPRAPPKRHPRRPAGALRRRGDKNGRQKTGPAQQIEVLLRTRPMAAKH